MREHSNFFVVCLFFVLLFISLIMCAKANYHCPAILGAHLWRNISTPYVEALCASPIAVGSSV